jgi:hypothetical protein
MRWYLLPVVSGFVLLCSAHGPTREPAPATTVVPTGAKTNAPVNCTKLPTDADWPSPEVWQTELKGVEAMMPEKLKHPQYIYEATRVEHVQNAVKFAVKHNIRLSVINTGHDFMGRNDAPSGLLLLVKGLKGIRLLQEYTPTAKGVEPVDSKTPTNVIQLKPGKQAVATVGGGVTGTELSTVAAASGLVAATAAHRMFHCPRL